LPIKNYVLEYFVIGVIPSQTLRISSGLQLRTASEHFFCHSERSVSGVKNLILFRVSNSEESPQETLPLRFAQGQGDKKGDR